MRILVVGSGGREHALVWKIAQSPLVEKVFCAPGNGGIKKLAECVDLGVTEVEKLAKFAKEQTIDLTVIGPELPLTLGVVDLFEMNGLRVFGCSQGASNIEGSKAFCKDFLRKYGIPSAEYGVFRDRTQAVRYVRSKKAPIVVKADGLAAGKGVVVAQTEKEAIEALDRALPRAIYVSVDLDVLDPSEMPATGSVAIRPTGWTPESFWPTEEKHLRQSGSCVNGLRLAVRRGWSTRARSRSG